jgi:HPt (histidine-containing phosphotransfer) domain-containing protein
MEQKQLRSLDTELLRSWQTLSQQGDDDFLSEVILIFLSSAPLLIESIEKELTEENWEALGRHVHKLRGSSANLGAVYLAEICGEIEFLASPPSPPSLLVPKVEKLKHEFNVVKRELEQHYLRTQS